MKYSSFKIFIPFNCVVTLLYYLHTKKKEAYLKKWNLSFVKKYLSVQ